MDVFTKLKGIFWETCNTSCWVLLLGVGYTPPKTFFVSFAFRDLGFKLIAFRLVFFMVKHTGIRLTKWLASRNGQFHIFVNNSFLNTNLGGFVVTI